MIRRRRQQHEPVDAWEADRWEAFDRLKSGLDRQEEARAKGPEALAEFARKASPLWGFITECDLIIRAAYPLRSSLAYGYWRTARGLERWVPPTGGPLRWTPPPTHSLPEQEQHLLSRDEVKKVEKEALKRQQRQLANEQRKRWRAEDRERAAAVNGGAGQRRAASSRGSTPSGVSQ